jgi:hypothetical protein
MYCILPHRLVVDKVFIFDDVATCVNRIHEINKSTLSIASSPAQ